MKNNLDLKINDLFFCYSNRLQLFLKIFGVNYLSEGVNSKNNKKYFIYKKTDKLKKILGEWDNLKSRIPLEK